MINTQAQTTSIDMDRMKNNNSVRGSRAESTIILIHPAKHLKINFSFNSVTDDT